MCLYISHIVTTSVHLLSILRTVEFGGIDHVGQGSLGLGPLTSLEATIWVDPELIGLEITSWDKLVI
jgi:hypothetical protein